ncbi:ABC transporter permease [Streptomyces sp. NPDC058307]|uniref:ABC transporter permease n=1 Tax=Streptomyces sp. NPDC058307 TaxID=3346439 RepID=UPI0036E29CE3
MFGPPDLLAEATAGILQRPARSVLTALGTVLGVGAFVAVLGLTATASSQIDARFDLLTATEVTVEDTAAKQNEFAGHAFPADAHARVGRLNGVQHAGVYWSVGSEQELKAAAAPVGDSIEGRPVDVVAASPGALRATVSTLAQGRLYDAYSSRTKQPGAVIGSGAAALLGITTLESHPAIFIGGQPFTVVGILSDVSRKADFLLSVMAPRTTAETLWGPPADGSKTLIATDIGAAVQIAAEAPTALRPDHPSRTPARRPRTRTTSSAVPSAEPMTDTSTRAPITASGCPWAPTSSRPPRV